MKTKTNIIFEDYEILREVLGTGISGKVLCCINKNTNIKYALKVLKDTEDARREVSLHWRACQECNYILKIFDIYENKINSVRMLCIITELMEGGELFDKILKKIEDKETFTEREVAKIMNQICNAIKHLHSMNIAHRDLKPENLLISNENEQEVIKLIDFGFAKEVDHGLKTPVFTTYYAAPEILKNRSLKLNEIKSYDKSCDIWSLGVIMFILCCGRAPFYRTEDTLKFDGNFDFLNGDLSKISDDAKQLIRGMLDTIPEKRLKIDDIVKNSWISQYNNVPRTPLSMATNHTLSEANEIINNTLNQLRTPNNLKIVKSLDEASNPLLKKRRYK